MYITEEVAVAEVGVAELRRDLKDWLERARHGEEVVVTERGKPIARLSAVGVPATIDRLVAEGRISPPRGPRIAAKDLPRIRSSGSVADLLIAARDEPTP